MTTSELAARLQEILGYRAPPEYQTTFDVLHRHVGRLKRDQRLPEGAARDQYLTFVRCCVSAVPKAVRASMLRRDIIADLEQLADNAIKDAWLDPAMKSAGVSIGDTIRFDAEYHGFLFSYRACLDYVDLGIRSYFADTKDKRPSFSMYAQLLARVMREPPVSALQAAFEEHQSSLRFAYGKDLQRNRAAHREFLKPAHVGAFDGELRLSGGGEEEHLVAGSRLSELLTTRLEVLNQFLLASFEALAQVDWP